MPAATTQEIVSTTTQVIVHPLVLLSVVDHVVRVTKGAGSSSKKRVVGILLGQDNGATVNVSNSYAVPFEEDERDPRTWFLDHNYLEGMSDMFKKINTREKVIGWYHTGPRLRASDLDINAVIKRYCARPVMVIVDVNKRGDLPTDAYFAVEEIKDDGTATQSTFMHVPTTIEAEEAEEIGVEHLLRDIKDLSTGTLSTRVADRLHSLRGLGSRLQEIRDYLDAVVKGELPVNHQIMYNLQDIFNLLPNLESVERNGYPGAKDDDGSARRPFTVATNDQLLVMYLSSLIRAVIALHNLVNNKIENQNLANGEIEDVDENSKEKKDVKTAGEDDKSKEPEKKDAKGKEKKDSDRGI